MTKRFKQTFLHVPFAYNFNDGSSMMVL